MEAREVESWVRDQSGETGHEVERFENDVDRAVAERLLNWLRELGLEEELPEAVFLETGANSEGPFDLSLLGADDTVDAVFGAGREALWLIAERIGAREFFLGSQRSGLAAGVVYAAEEAFEDEHFKARGFQVPVRHDDPDRTVLYPGAPYRFTGSPWRISRRAPRLGEHNDEVFVVLKTGSEPRATGP